MRLYCPLCNSEATDESCPHWDYENDPRVPMAKNEKPRPTPYRLAYTKGMDLNSPDAESWQLEVHGMLAPRWFNSRAEGETYIASLA